MKNKVIIAIITTVLLVNLARAITPPTKLTITLGFSIAEGVSIDEATIAIEKLIAKIKKYPGLSNEHLSVQPNQKMTFIYTMIWEKRNYWETMKKEENFFQTVKDNKFLDIKLLEIYDPEKVK